MRRRRLLSIGAGAVVVTVAGCTDEAEPLIDEDLITVRALPEPGDGWSAEDPEPLAIDGSDAEEGTGREYVSPDGDEYRVAILRWPDAEAAERGAAADYGEWTRSIAHEDLSFACNGPDEGVAEELLAASPKLADEDV